MISRVFNGRTTMKTTNCFILKIFLIILFSYCVVGRPQSNTLSEIKYVTDRVKFPLRTRPGSDEKIINIIENGQELEIVESENEWTKVKMLDGKQGWILIRYIVQYPYSFDDNL